MVGLDEGRISEDIQWDGYAGIQSSETNLDARSVIDAYHQLWKIERAFRVLKSTMRTRPIFHWTPRRIKGNFVVCFIAFVLERALEKRLKSNKQAASAERIKEALNSLKVSRIKLGEQLWFITIIST